MKQSDYGNDHYQVGGALSKEFPAYVRRDADEQLYQALKAEEFCYVLNSRQMGKTSLMVRTLAQLQLEGWAGIVLDFSAKESRADQPERWYNGIINQLNRQFGLQENTRQWIKERDVLAPVERLGEFIESVLLHRINQPIVLFIDEIDSTLNLPFTDDFFALIRACYNRRADNPNYQRLTFVLLGVAAPSELISDRKRTPFNIGQAIDLKGFQGEEAEPLMAGLVDTADRPQWVLQEILRWTGGQPFLTQRMCRLVVDRGLSISTGDEYEVIGQLAHTYLIEGGESQDEQEHLKTIRNRLLNNEQKAGYLLELYRRILRTESLKFQNTVEERDLQLSGLVVKREGHLTVYNPVYAQVFNEDWIDRELIKLRPYAENFRAWISSGKTDRSRLLRGDALVQAEEWAVAKSLSGEDRDFIAASRTQVREEEIAEKEQEAKLDRERQARAAAEEAKEIQAIATQKAQRRIRFGSFILGSTLLLTLGSGLWAIDSGKKAANSQKLAEQASTELKNTQSKLESKQSELESADEKLDSVKEERQEAVNRLREAGMKLTEAEKKTKQAESKSKAAAARQQGAETLARKAKEESDKAMGDVRIAQQQKQKAQQKLVNAQKLEHKARQDLAAAQQAQAKSEKKLGQAKVAFNEINQSLEAVRSLSQLAGELRRNGNDRASDEALRKAGLSTLIKDEALKQAWLLAATAEGYLSENDKAIERGKALSESLNSLKSIKSEAEPRIFNQVKAFAYLISGSDNNDRIEDYEVAYQALTDSQFEAYDAKTESDILTDKDVEVIHYKLIESANKDINSTKDEVAISFRKHLYQGLDVLLQSEENRLKEADQKTFEIMLYLSGRPEEGSLSVESLKTFSCDALKEIDKRWYNYPGRQGHFGFRMQKETWLEYGSPNWDASPEIWRKIYIDYGWKTEESGFQSREGYIRYDELDGFRNVSISKEGNLPTTKIRWESEGAYSFLALRILACKI